MRAQTYTRFAPRPRLPLYDKGVDLKRRPPKSRPTAFPWRIASPPKGGPQGLRRPRFSFFRFTCQTARDDGSPILGRTEGRRNYELPTEIGSCPASKSEELRRRAIAPSRGRHAVFALYTLRPRRMSTHMVKNLTPRTCSTKRPLAPACDGDAALRPHFWQHFHL